MIDDFDLIISSFQTQYGIRLSRDINGMKWAEFRSLVSGLGPDTPLGRIVAIRSEENEDVLRNFTQNQLRIRREWREKKAKEVSKEELNVVLDGLLDTFKKMAGVNRD